jgi:DNA ligase-1
LKEGALIKVKQFTDDEATVIGFEEEFENLNEATVNALGHTERSSHQANKRGKGTLGALVCVTKDGAEFRIGTGFKRDERQALWDRRDTLPGSTVKFKSFLIGVKVAPRFPTFLGFRDSIDM